MEPTEEITSGPDVVGAFLGQDRAVTFRLMLFAIVLALFMGVMNYIHMANIEDIAQFGGIENTPLFLAIVSLSTDPVFIGGLAAVHAYLNEGYLPAVLLAATPVVSGDMLNYAGPFGGPYTIYIDLVEGISEAIPYVLPYATLGFLVGFAIRLFWVEVLDRPEPI